MREPPLAEVVVCAHRRVDVLQGTCLVMHSRILPCNKFLRSLHAQAQPPSNCRINDYYELHAIKRKYCKLCARQQEARRVPAACCGTARGSMPTVYNLAGSVQGLSAAWCRVAHIRSFADSAPPCGCQPRRASACAAAAPPPRRSRAAGMSAPASAVHRAHADCLAVTKSVCACLKPTHKPPLDTPPDTRTLKQPYLDSRYPAFSYEVFPEHRPQTVQLYCGGAKQGCWFSNLKVFPGAVAHSLAYDDTLMEHNTSVEEQLASTKPGKIRNAASQLQWCSLGRGQHLKAKVVVIKVAHVDNLAV